MLYLTACPRVAPLGWPHSTYRRPDSTVHRVVYQWVYVKPDGSGWTTEYDDSLLFPESKLEDVLEGFYGFAGPWPFDFQLTVVDQPEKAPPPKLRYRGVPKTKRMKKATKKRKSKRPAVKKRRT